MTKEELYLKTIFCCIACDGDIATEEVGMVRELCAKDKLFHDIDSEKCINPGLPKSMSRAHCSCNLI